MRIGIGIGAMWRRTRTCFRDGRTGGKEGTGFYIVAVCDITDTLRSEIIDGVFWLAVGCFGHVRWTDVPQEVVLRSTSVCVTGWEGMSSAPVGVALPRQSMDDPTARMRMGSGCIRGARQGAQSIEQHPTRSPAKSQAVRASACSRLRERRHLAITSQRRRLFAIWAILSLAVTRTVSSCPGGDRDAQTPCQCHAEYQRCDETNRLLDSACPIQLESS